ncbi:MAG: hypothetical protein GEV07_04430 [Streptosporangiales bacterium]|nr:hypothetical protein [Streptosporangiales bacterium]
MQILFSGYAAEAGLATDLVNTSALVRGAGEALTDPAALERFLGEHDISPGAQLADGDVHQVHALRDEVRAVLESSTDDEVAEGANALLARARVTPTLARDAQGRWQWYLATSDAASVADEVAASVGVGLLGALYTLGHDRFRPCASPDCNGMFVDTSRAGRRRYCMPDLCGNRLNVANHRARRRTGQGTD